MDEILSFCINAFKKLDNGTLPDFPDPFDPPDLGSPLTQDEIDTLKKFVKEIKERFLIL